MPGLDPAVVGPLALFAGVVSALAALAYRLVSLLVRQSNTHVEHWRKATEASDERAKAALAAASASDKRADESMTLLRDVLTRLSVVETLVRDGQPRQGAA